MENEITQRDEFYTYDYTAETNIANNNTDLSKPHTDFFNGVKEKILTRLSSNKKRYHSLSWYISEHEKYGLSVAYKSISKPCAPGTRNLKNHTKGNLRHRKLFQRERHYQSINRVSLHRQPHLRKRSRRRTQTLSRILR